MVPGRARLRRAVTLTLTAILCAACGGNESPPALHARLEVPAIGYVLVKEPLQVTFDRKVKGARSVTLAPATDVTSTAQGKKLLIAPAAGWVPGTTYSLKLGEVTSADGVALKSFQASFRTQPRHGVAGFLVGGQAVTGTPSIPAGAPVTIAFTDPMNVQSVQPTVNGTSLPAAGFKWADDAKSLQVLAPTLPFQTYVYAVAGQMTTAGGEALTDSAALTAHAVAVEPSNAASGIPAGFKTIPPVQVVVEDTADSRPQSGFQAADLVFEYISEYSANRMTALYFNQAPATVGPVRSCRSINAFLVFGFQGVLMCAGVADGTQHYIPGGGGHGTRPAPAVIEDLDAHQYFYRGPGIRPHNLYTSTAQADQARAKFPADPSTTYFVDPPHADNGLGQPSEPPSVGLQRVGYSYDGGSQQYLRFEGGAPFTAAETGAQLKVKNIAILHVPFHYTNWSEDGCCALSVWYEMIGTGAAEVYSDGRLVHATWHMGQAGQDYQSNNTPLWFSDDSTGLPIQINTGLTWVHVVGNGQTS